MTGTSCRRRLSLPLLLLLVVGSLAACSSSGHHGPQTATVANKRPLAKNASPTGRAAPKVAAKEHRDQFAALVGAGRAGFFKWRCTSNGAIIRFRPHFLSPTVYVRVYEGTRLVVKGLMEPAKSLSLLLPNVGQRWIIKQATEPLTLSVKVLIEPKRAEGHACLEYLPPTVHMKSEAHSH